MKTLILGHRGYKAKYIENTRPSFMKALECGADGIELDVHLTKDGQVVVFHDFELSRMTKEKGFIFEYSLEEIKKMKVKNNHEIPTLEEVVDDLVEYKRLHSRLKVYLNVEFKAGSQMYEGIEAKVMKICYSKLTSDEVIFSSFDHHCLVNIKALDSNAQVGVLTTASLVEPWTYLKSLAGDFYHPNYLTLSPKNLREMMVKGLLINAYTVNKKAVAKQLMAAGIHMIITDEVEKIVTVRKEVQGEA
jgi:glycerophosphoryl diester phosphodiesterase